MVLGSLPLGCYAPAFSDCELRCSTANTCPAGQMCDGQFCRAPMASGTCMAGTIDSPMGSESTLLDRDSDTILDDIDNCPTMANRDQANEDGDMFGNVCDPCPPAGPPGNLDPDSDGVGDACDPNPLMPGDSIAMFEGFEQAPIATGLVTTGMVLYPSGQAQILGSATAAGLMWPVTASPGRVVSTRFTIDAMSGPPALIGVADRVMTTGTTSGVACEAGLATDAMPKLVAVELPAIEGMFTSIAIGNGVSATVAQRRSGRSYTCRVEPGGQQLLSTSSTNETQSMVRAGIRSRSVSAHVDWVMIVNTP